MALTIGELTGFLRLDDTLFGRGVNSARRQLASLKKDVDESARNIRTIGEAAQTIGRPAGMAALAAGAVSITGAALPAAGALLAGGAAAGVAGAAFGALKMGTAGVGDALSALADGDAAKAAEALAELSPNAQVAVRAMDGVRKSYEGVQQRVQDAVFADMGADIAAVGSTYLPILDRGLVAVGGSLNSVGRSFMAAAQGAAWMGAVEDILGATPGIVEDLGTAALGLVTSFLQAGRAAIPMVQAFAAWARDGMAAAGAFLSSAEGAQWLADKVNAAQRALSLVWGLASAVGAALMAVFSSASVSGEGLLLTLTRIAQEFATWAQSAEGQAQLAAVFESLRVVLDSLLQTFVIFGGALGTLLGWFAQLPAPVQSVVAGFLSWSLLLGGLVAKFAPLIAFLARLGPLLMSGAGAIVMAAARWGLLGTAAATAAAGQNASVLRIIAGWLRMALAATVNGIRAGLAWLMIAGPQAAAAVATMVATAARVVAQWTLMAVQSLARAAMMAASWIIAMGPIGWIIAAIVALVALVIANWDTIRNATVAAWNAVSNAVSSAAQAVVQWVRNLVTRVLNFVLQMGARLVVLMVTAWVRARAAVVNGVTAVVNFVRTLPQRILSALASLGSLLVSVGGDLLRGLWRGISNAMGWLLGKVRSIGSSILSAARSALGIGSPSKEMADQVGRWLPAGVAVGVDGNTRPLSRSMKRLGDTAIGALPSATGSVRGPGSLDDMSPEDIAAAVEAGVAGAFSSGRMTVRIDGRGVARLVNRQNAEDRRLGSARVPAATGRR